jgi:hypothetical protein
MIRFVTGLVRRIRRKRLSGFPPAIVLAGC